MFQIESVELENFRSYRGKHSITLPTEPGLYLLTGRNEVEPRLGTNDCGKSTLLDAIFWCLFGRTSRGLKAADIINWDETSCSVTVGMWLSDIPLIVKRTQNPNSLQRSNGAVPLHPVSQDDLQKRLGLGPDAFLYAMMLPQFGESFFDLTPAAKLTLFSQIMGLDYWLEKSEEAGKLSIEIDVEIQDTKHQISRHEGQIELMSVDLHLLGQKQSEFVEAQKRVVATLGKDKNNLKTAQRKTAEAIEFAEKALLGATNRLAKIEKGTKVCPTCQQTVPNHKAKADEAALHKNKIDFERQLINLRSNQAVTNRELEHTSKSIEIEQNRANPYGEQIRQKQAQLQTCKGQLQHIKRNLNECEQEHAAVSFWVGGFKRVRLFIVEETLRQLELEVNNNLSSLGLTDWRIEFDVERENKSGGVTKGFVVFVYAPGRTEPVRFEAWSGGATQRLRMAGDLGLASLIMLRAGLTSGVEFFDEPSRHLSEEGQLDLAETLMQRALNGKKVIYLCDHNLIDFAFTGTTIIVKDSNGSRIENAKGDG